MRRSSTLIGSLGLAGVVALVAGTTTLVGVGIQALESPAYADSAPFEVFCTDTLLGANVVLNDVTFSGVLSSASPSPGQSFSLDNFQGQVVLPPSVAQTASSVGSVSGTWSVGVEASGASPSSLPAQDLPFDLVAPSNPSSSLSIVAPSNPVTVGPFTATSNNITLTLTPTVDVTFNFGGSEYSLTCTSYPNDVLPSGITNALPPGAPVSPTIATAGQVTTPPPTPVTGPYELYCPHTPVGDLVFNDVSTSATISPATLSAGDQFQVSGYQTDIPVPSGAVTAAVGLGNASFVGVAASAVDAYGATSSQVPTGSMGFDVPIPTPVPSSGVTLDIPTSPTTIGPFTAAGGPITVAQDQSVLVVAELSSKAFKMSCTAYPNDTIATSGTTGTPPGGTPIRPIIATASASGTPAATTTTTFQPGGPGPGNQTPGAPYELYCPNTPVGNIALNDVVTTGSITPSSLNQGDQFQVTNLQTQFTIPQNVAQQAENLGLTTLSGDLSLFLDVSGTENNGFPGPIVGVASGTATATASSSSSSSTATTVVSSGPFPGPFPGVDDMSFDVTLPSPVPSTGVQFTATTAAGSPSETFVAAGGPIQAFASGANLNVSAFGDRFGLFCETFANDTVPTGLSIQRPNNGFIEPVIATAQAAIPPAPPSGGPYELYCPGTPVGSIVMNDVTDTGTISPPDPAPGESFSVTGYQTNLSIPQDIVAAAQALGNISIAGSATTQVDASGATPAAIPSGAMSFDVPIPTPVPSSGLALAVPSAPATIGPFTASGGTITISQGQQISLTLFASGSDTAPPFTLTCATYPNDTVPFSGITSSPPVGSPISPVIASTGPVIPPVTTPSTPPTTTPPGGTAGPYELYCPGTPVGNIALNDVTTTATIPTVLSSGQTFNASNFQTQVTIPSSIASAAAALGNTAITGTAVVKVDATGATPATVSAGDIAINAPLPSPVPSTGITLELPSTPGTVGPFTATGDAITLTLDPIVQLTLVVSGSDLSLTCKPYTNNSAPTGIVSSAPSGSPVSPVIATESLSATPTTIAGTGAGTTTTTPVSPGDTSTTSDVSTSTIQNSTTSDVSTTTIQDSTTSAPPAPSTTIAPATKASAGSSSSSTSDLTIQANSGSLAFTGSGAPTEWIVAAGAALVILGLAMLMLVDAPRRLRFVLVRRTSTVRGGPLGAGRSNSGTRLADSPEQLWVKDA
jgi:hypothetical protein